MNTMPTTFNVERARILADMILAGEVCVSLPIPAGKGKSVRGVSERHTNPHFIAILHAGSTPAEKLANARALLEKLKEDAHLRASALDQGIDPEAWEEMLSDAQREEGAVPDE